MKQAALLSGEWVVVCDGRKAFNLENAGENKFVNLRSKEVYDHADPPTHAQGTDTPRRTLRLDDALSRGETNAFIVIAAPRALGMIRPAYTPAVRRAVKAEIGKDYVKMPIYEIEKTFTG